MEDERAVCTKYAQDWLSRGNETNDKRTIECAGDRIQDTERMSGCEKPATTEQAVSVELSMLTDICIYLTRVLYFSPFFGDKNRKRSRQVLDGRRDDALDGQQRVSNKLAQQGAYATAVTSGKRMRYEESLPRHATGIW